MLKYVGGKESDELRGFSMARNDNSLSYLVWLKRPCRACLRFKRTRIDT